MKLELYLNKGSVSTGVRKGRKVSARKNSLVSALAEDANVTRTENGAKTFKSTKSKVLDLFSRGGAMRAASDSEIINLVSAAWAEDSLLTLKTLFYLRNVRGTGQGERRFFRVATKWLAENFRSTLVKNLKLVADFGRWDDVVSLIETPVSNEVIDLVNTQLRTDIASFDKGDFKKLSLISKWLPSHNASSKKTKRLASYIYKGLKLSPKNYRKILSALRSKVNIVERDMTSGNWAGINYQVVPSRASSIYSKAFRKHDADGYQAFLDSVQKGEAKINASTLYPYDLVSKARRSNDATVDAQWKALPDYTNGSDRNVLTVVDVSRSMTWTAVSPDSSIYPIDVAISMGIYFGERIKGAFNNMFMTFSSSPTLQKIEGATLATKINSLVRSNWSGSTNIQAVFDKVLNTAIRVKASQSDMPSSIIILSDMEFNNACRGVTNYELIKSKYKKYGYEMPQLVFWNVQARNAQSPVKMGENGVSLVSGFSPSVFKYVTSGVMKTPYEIMLDTLNDPIFDKITV